MNRSLGLFPVASLAFALLLLPQVMADIDDGHRGMGDMWRDMPMWGGGTWAWMWPIVLVGLGVLAYVIYVSIRPRHYSQPRSDLAAFSDQVRIAGDRLAKGEITSEEFDQIKKRLE